MSTTAALFLPPRLLPPQTPRKPTLTTLKATSTSPPQSPRTLFPQISPTALHSIHSLYHTANAAPHPGICAHTLGRRSTALLQQARSQIAAAINASSPAEIHFPPSLPAASALLATHILSTARKRDQVLLSAAESDHVRLTWESAAKWKDVKIRIVGDARNAVSLLDIAPKISARTKAIVLQVGSVFGARNNLEEVGAFAEGVGVPLVADVSAALAVGERVDVDKMRCAYVVGDGGVVGGLPGTAFLWARGSGDGAMLEFEQGMTWTGGAVALGAAMAEWEDSVVGEGEGVGEMLVEELGKVCGVRVLGDGMGGRLAMACFVPPAGAKLEVVARELAERGVFVGAGMHGCWRAHREVGVDDSSLGSLRVVLRAGDGEKDVERVVQRVKDVLEFTNLPGGAALQEAYEGPPAG